MNIRTSIRTLNILYLIFFWTISIGVCSDSNRGIKNFSKSTYHAASQNWGVESDANGFVYFANHKGLLEFDGTSWQLHELPNQTIIRSILIDNDSIIYTSGYREFGFWKRDYTGRLFYTSLNPEAQHLFSKNEEFWNIEALNSNIYFHSFNRLFEYRHDTIVPIDLPGFTSTMNRVGDQILIAVKDQGIYSVDNGNAKPYFIDPFFKGKTIRFIIPYQNERFLIGTASNGIVLCDGKQIEEWNPEWTSYFSKNELNRACISTNDELIFGTIIDGVVIFDIDGRFIRHINISNGMQNNTVLGISTDQFNNIWLALDSGIDFISSASPTGVIVETIPDIGVVYSAAIFQGKIYLGTNQGLFEKDQSATNAVYRMLSGTQGQVWDCRVIDDRLLVGHNAGTFIVDNGNAKQISSNSGAFATRPDTKHPNLLLQSTYSNLVVYKRSNGNFTQSHLVDGFYDLIRFLEIDHLGNIWASHMHRGIYKIQLDDERRNVVSQKYFGEKSVFGKEHSLNVFKIEDRIVFTTEDKLYTYDDLNDTIIPYAFLNDRLGEYAASRRIIQGPGHHYWLITPKSIALCRISSRQVDILRTFPASVFQDHTWIDEFENIYPVTETSAILCLEDGIAWLDATTNDTAQTIRYQYPQLREVQVFNKKNEGTYLQPKNKNLQIAYKENNIQLRYSFPLYTDAPVYFQTYMKGIDPGWSAKARVPIFRFDRLPVGTYELYVKAIDLWNNESQPYVLTIKVLPPWYQTRFAQISYLAFLILITLAARTLGIRKIRRKEQIEHDKREQELIRLRNEKLNAEISHKSRELANSTMSMIKKNEFLLELRRIVDKQKEQLGSRYPDKYYLHLTEKIEENISSHDDWQLFETNFEQAHEQFLKKIKEAYPDLTNKDLRLCAYLRMNLASKEIAPLLGISVRGVENHRYRLRRKMNMEHDDNLIDYILKY